MKHILILSASVGAGHLRAAEAVETAAHQMLPNDHVENVDVLSLTNAAFRRIYGKAYLDLVNKAPYVLGYFYDLMDRPSTSGRSDRLRTLLERANFKKLNDLLEAQKWDLVIHTHFLPAELAARLKNKGQVTFPQVTVTTDFETHRLWINTPCDLFFTATQEGALHLQSYGVPPQNLRVTGIPIHPRFSTLSSRSECVKKFGLVGDRPILLQLAGGFGAGPIEKVHRTLLEMKTPIELVTVCGKNQAVAEKLKSLPCPSIHKRHVLGYTTEMDEWMTVADLIVSKPGGLTSSEALATGSPMVIINPIPGQESRNSDYLLESGVAIKANNLSTLGYKIERLLKSPDRLELMKAEALKISHPRAAFEILRQSLELIR